MVGTVVVGGKVDGGGQDVETTTVVAGDSAVAGQTVRVKSDQRNLSLLLAVRSPGSASVCLSVCLSICLSAVYLSVCLSICLSAVYMSFCPSVCLSAVCLSVCLFVCLLYICLSVCLPLSLSLIHRH